MMMAIAICVFLGKAKSNALANYLAHKKETTPDLALQKATTAEKNANAGALPPEPPGKGSAGKGMSPDLENGKSALDPSI